MKKIFLIYISIILAKTAFAQKETYDLISYIAPKGWKNELLPNSNNYTSTNKTNNSWCQIRIIKSTASKGNIDLDFKSEWQALVVPNYNPGSGPVSNKTEESDGWKIKSGTGTFIFNNVNTMVTMVTMSGYSRCVSIVATTNNTDYLKDINALLASVDVKKPATASSQPATVNNDGASIFGTWDNSSSDQSSFSVNNGVNGYIVSQYTFRPDGTYSFYTKTFKYELDKLLLVRENGTFQISGNSIGINPQKSILETWSKKNNVDNWGKLLNTQNRTLEKLTYQFTKHYFSGIHEWNLIMQANKQTQRDGPFNGGSSFSNSWIYSPVSSSHPLIKLPN